MNNSPCLNPQISSDCTHSIWFSLVHQKMLMGPDGLQLSLSLLSRWNGLSYRDIRQDSSLPVTVLNTSMFHVFSLELSLLITKPIKIKSSLCQDEYLAPIGHVIMRWDFFPFKSDNCGLAHRSTLCTDPEFSGSEPEPLFPRKGQELICWKKQCNCISQVRDSHLKGGDWPEK